MNSDRQQVPFAPTGSTAGGHLRFQHRARLAPWAGKRVTPMADIRGATRRWTINGDFLALRPHGVARYAREVTLALDTLIAERHPLARDLRLDIVAPRVPPEPLDVRWIPLRIVPEYAHPRLPQLWAQAQLPFYVAGGLLSFCNLAPIAVRKHIVCVHDLHTRLAPESYGRLFRWAHRIILPILGRRAARITTVSAFSQRHLVDFGVAPAEKIVVAPNGSDHAKRWDSRRATLDFEGTRPFVLCLAQRQAYKNTEIVLEIAPALDRLGLDVWMAGDLDPAALVTNRGPLPANIRCLGRIGDDDLAAVFSRALCFLFPSRIEGFGLPAVEAMARGCPVVASSAPSLPDTCGDAALYADPDDGPAWITAVKRLQRDPRLRQSLVDAGRTRAEQYSWRAVALTYLELMDEIDGTSKP